MLTLINYKDNRVYVFIFELNDLVKKDVVRLHFF